MTEANEDTPDEDTGILARRLIRSQATAALSSVAADGQPHASLVLSSCDLAARPVLLMSRLAVHTRNLETEPRAALLYEDCRDLESPLTGPRLTVSGRLEVATDAGLRARFLRRHADAEMYADFADFDFYRLEVSSAHLVAGFGRIETITAAALLFSAPGNEALATDEADLIAQINTEQAGEIDELAARLDPGAAAGWTLTGIDAEGLDLRCRGRRVRASFDAPLAAADLRAPGFFARIWPQIRA